MPGRARCVKGRRQFLAELSAVPAALNAAAPASRFSLMSSPQSHTRGNFVRFWSCFELMLQCQFWP
eukprot:10353745-Alexandrium_andersonii.AAC.1